MPNLRFGVRSGVAICVGLLAIFGCTDQLGEILTHKPDPTKPPNTSVAPTGSASTGEDRNDAGDGGPDTPEGGSEVPCENQVLDEGETALDCGGMCQPCGVGLGCKQNSDCVTGSCKDNVCLALGCDNGTIDGNESDTDCGRGCALCDDGKLCKADADCKSKVCGSDGKCQVPSCDDEHANGAESDIDCGPGCDPCDNGSMCTKDDHCESGACVSNICADPGCTDKEQNGSETDLDCGGGCPACADDLKCKLGTDCQSGICAPVTSTINRCVEATCDDTAINGRETDLNCGGMCDPCADGKKCLENSDCISQVCKLVDGQNYSQCSAPSCEDDVRNGNESAPDCGGDCDGCDDTAPCRENDDCKSEHCDESSKLCVAASCEDERQNQGESDKDCGGPCDGCGVGQMCSAAADCVSARCDQSCQPGGAGATCGDDDDCVTGSCSNNDTCAKGYAGDGCYDDGDCALDTCGSDKKCPKGYTGAACDSDSDCFSGTCIGDTCGLGGVGDTCASATDCVSNVCSDAKCAATRTSVRSQGASDQTFIKIQLWVQANSQDPQVNWANVAILYFFTPEVHNNFYCKNYGLDAGTRSERFVAQQFSASTTAKPYGDWVAIWRSSPTNTSAIPANQESNLELQIYNEPNSELSNTSDHSYQTGSTVNPNIVLCVRRDGTWVHAQGTPPAGSGEVCKLVVDTCPADPEFACDQLEWRD